ncbi:MAG: AMP-binding protein [Flavobacteriales bacterium]|nr:AMP-binding protein [Flavobacteriales bacterium]
MSLKSPLEMLYKWESETPDNVYLSQPIDGVLKEWTWKEAATEVRKMAAVIKGMDLEPNSNIGIISKNCAHWIMNDLAIMMAGHVSIPMYPNLNDSSVRQILEHSEAKVVFVGKLDDWASMKPGMPDGIRCITYPFYAEAGYETWDDLTEGVEPISENVVPTPDTMYTIIYTSGTTGMPKGVMHTFHNMSFAATHALTKIGLNNKDSFFSYLPLCHIAEKLLVHMGGLYSGGKVNFAESLDTFAANLAAASPTVFLGVPRIWTKFQQGILGKLPQAKMDKLLGIPILGGLIKKKVRKGLGLNDAQHVFTGAAPTPAALIKWFAKLGIYIQEAYAMTENCCYSHVTFKDNIKIGYVGAALPYCEVKIDDNGEILIKHEALMTSYYKEPELTAETIVDGYLRTGDKGEIDSEGFLKITGRVKDIFKTSKAKYVAPAPIEMKLSTNTNLEQICVVGTNVPQPIALTVLSEAGKQLSNEEIDSSLSETLNVVNPQLDHHENIAKFVILKDDWTVENGLITPTMKVKRPELEKIHEGNYEAWYEAEGKVVWQ